MRKKILSVLLSMALLATSVDFTVFATEQESEVAGGETQTVWERRETEEDIQDQMDFETDESDFMEKTQSDNAVEKEETEKETEPETEGNTLIPESEIWEEDSSENGSEISSEEESSEAQDDVKAGGKEISRIEWVSALTAVFEMTVEESNYPDNYFSDITSDASYYHDVMLAAEFGLINVEAGEPFCPDDGATREFVAHTLNLCLQYAPEAETYAFSESKEVTYPDDIQVAIELGWFETDSEKKFYPDQTLKESEETALLNFAKKEVASQKIDENDSGSFAFKSGVIVLPEDVGAALTDENEITLTNCDVTLNVGDIFGLVSGGVPFAKKVEGIVTKGNQKIIRVSEPAQEEAYETINIQGTSAIPLTEVEAVETENVEILYIVGGTREKKWEDGEKYDSAEGLDEDEISVVEITKSYPLTSKQRERFEIADGINAEISCKFLNVNADWSNNSDECMVSLSTEVVFDFNLDLDVYGALGVNPSIEVARIPILYFGYASVTLDASLSGNVAIDIVEYVSLGIKFDKKEERFRFVKEFRKKYFSIASEMTLSLGETVRLGFDAFGILNGSLYAEFGAKTQVRNKTYTDGNEPINCTHVESWFFANTGGYVKAKMLKSHKLWDYNKKIYTKDNSPARVSFHYEDGKAVDRCTRDKSGTMYKYYTPANSKYGYNGMSSGIGSDGKPFTIFEYSLNDVKEATITKYSGNVSALRIPEELDGYPVVGIGNNVFKGNTLLRMVVMPDSMTKIDSGAFANCTKLSNVVLSKGLIEMNNSAFRNCDALTTIEIPKSLKKVTNWYNYTDGVFCECNNLKEVTFEPGTTKIVNSLFENCPGIERIEIPDTVTVIESYAFDNCENLKEIKIPESVTEIGNNAFSSCAALKEVVISNNVVSIGSRAFGDCKSLTEVVIPDSVTKIDSGAFANCTKLSSVVLSKGLTEMNNSAFCNCDALTTIEIPKSLKTVTNWSGYTNGVFCECDNLKEVTFELGTTKIVNSLFENCPGIERIEIPDTVTVIESYAFDNCANLRTAIIPNSVTEIESRAFKDCIKLEKVTLPDSVTDMGDYIFSGCNSLKEAKLPNIRKNLTEGTFKDCINLEKVNFPETLEYIRSYAFYNTKISEAVLPKKLLGIERYAFYNCDNLTKVEMQNGITDIGNYAFYDCDALTDITIPDSVTSLGSYTFAESERLSEVVLGTGLTKIPTYAFNLCPSLQKIIIPYRVTTIESNAFTNCTKLTEVIIPRATTSISGSVFSYPDRLTIYGISGTYAETYANQIGANFVNKEVTATDVTLSDTTLSMITGAKHTLALSITPGDFTDEVVWKSSDTNIITVDNTGIITAKAVGTATVRVAVGEKTASCTVTVLQPVTYISLDQYRLSLEAFETYTLKATVSPADAADKSVEWTSSDETVAIVSQNGTVTPLAKGTATIKVTAKDGSGKYGSCNVTVLSDGQLCTQYSSMESAHNYANNTNKVWKYQYHGAKTLDITFDSRTNVDAGFDYLYIYDKDNKEIKKATGTELADKTVRIEGDTVKIKLISDEAVTAWGFKVTKIIADGNTIGSGEETPDIPESSTESSSEEESETEESEGDIGEGFHISGLKTKTYTGSAVKQDIKVYYNKHLLQEGVDYTLSYKNNKNVGNALVTVKAKGNLTGSVTKTFQIQPRKISDTNVIIEDAVYTYDKKQHKKAPAITYNGKALKEGKDYKVTNYGEGDYTTSGTYTVQLSGIGNFTGSFDDAKVIIADKDKNIGKAKIAKIPAQEYQNGTAVELAERFIRVELNKTVLKKDIDYTVSYANNTNVGKATLIIKGKGSYAGTKKMKFVIKRTPVVLSANMIKNQDNIASVEIVKGGAKPEPILMTDGITLVKGRDYTLSYKNNKAAGANALIVIKGKGNYKGSLTFPFSITTKSLTSSAISARVPDVPYNKKPNKYQSKPVITDNDGCVLTANKDYTIESYRAEGEMLDKTSNPKQGTAITVMISGKGNYTGQISANYEVRGTNFASANIKVKEKGYTGDEIFIMQEDILSANIKVDSKAKTLQFGKDYEVAAYKSNVKKGTASVTFRGLGDYAGEKTVKFKINSGKISN